MYYAWDLGFEIPEPNHDGSEVAYGSSLFRRYFLFCPVFFHWSGAIMDVVTGRGDHGCWCLFRDWSWVHNSAIS